MISESKTIDVFVTLLKQVLSAKIGGRINVVRTVEEVHERVPKELLPKDYGGDGQTLEEVHGMLTYFIEKQIKPSVPAVNGRSLTVVAHSQ